MSSTSSHNDQHSSAVSADGGTSSSSSSSAARVINLAQQCHENDIAKLVLVHEPGIEALIGSLHASGSLFEKPVNVQKARDDHMHFRRAMENKGVKVLSVREILAMHCEDNLRYRVALEELALEVLQYKLIKKQHTQTQSGDVPAISNATVASHTHTHHHPLHNNHMPPTIDTSNNLTKVQKHLLSDDYKRDCLSKMGTNDLIDLIMLGPTCGLAASHSNTPLRLDNLQMKPLLNLTFTRDQQIVTNKGLCLMNMGSPQRLRETRIMNFCFNKLSVPILGKIEEPGTCEGGDFISAGADLCFIGTGLRTNQNAIDQLLQNDWFGTRRVAVCRDLFDCDQQRMHLDTVFNICSNDCVVMLDTMIGEQSPIRRLVTEYTQIVDTTTGRKEYIVTKKDVELSKYVQDEGYHIIPVSQEQQSAYGINFLNLGNGFLVCADESTARTILKNEHFDGDVQVIDFTGMISMFGCLHCCSQVLQRQPAPVNFKHHKPATKKVVTSAEVLVHRDGVPANVCQNLLFVSPSYYDPTSVVEPKNQNTPFTSAIQEDIENSSRSRPLNPDHLRGMNMNYSTSPIREENNSFNKTRSFTHSVSSILNADATADKSLNLSFSHLDGLLRVHGLNTFLFAQYTNDKNRDAVFAAHTLSSVNGKCIFFPVSPIRQTEIKEGTLELMQRLYKDENVIHFKQFISGNDEYFHGGNIVFDRANSRAYLLQLEDTDNSEQVKQAVTRCMDQVGYSTHSFSIKNIESYTYAQKPYLFENANAVLFVGSTFALLCSEMIQGEEQLETLRQLLSSNGTRTIIDITLQQQQSHAINGIIEVADENGKQLLMMSESGWMSLTEEQQQLLLNQVECVETVDLRAIEEINGGSLNDMAVSLF